MCIDKSVMTSQNISKTFNKPFTQQLPLSESAIASAVELLQNGRLHRYNTIAGEIAATSQLEQEFSNYMQQQFCLACTSGGYAIYLALKIAGVKNGDKVITNAFTLAPVPGAIDNVGAEAVFVDMDDNLCTDLRHLKQLMQTTDASVFLMSHMRGHLADMEVVCQLCNQYKIILIEDCAHTMGARWNGKLSGSFGDLACFSTQTYKHMNSGEGGLLTTNNPQWMAQAIILSGSYMLYERHGTVPAAKYFGAIIEHTPNYSGRMDNLRATLLLDQLQYLDEHCQQWNRRYKKIEQKLANCQLIHLPQRPDSEYFVGSSIQFCIPSWSADQIEKVLSLCMERGVELKWFGRDKPSGFTSSYHNWKYFLHPSKPLPNTDRLLSTLLDMRIPLTFDNDDMQQLGDIIVDCVETVNNQ